MTELADVIAGNIVDPDWGNAIRDRTVQRYVGDFGDLDTAYGSPPADAGVLVYLEGGEIAGHQQEPGLWLARFLGSDIGGDPEWFRVGEAPMFWRGVRTITQAIPTSTDTVVQWTPDIDFHGGSGVEDLFDETTFEFLATRDGLYHVVAAVRWDTNTAGTRGLDLVRNSTKVRTVVQPPSALAPSHNIATLLPLARGDRLGVTVLQSSGANRNVGGAAATTYFEVAHLGALPTRYTQTVS